MKKRISMVYILIDSPLRAAQAELDETFETNRHVVERYIASDQRPCDLAKYMAEMSIVNMLLAEADYELQAALHVRYQVLACSN